MNLAELVRAGLPDLMRQHGHQLTANQRQALRAIVDCRTGALGTALMGCNDCGHRQYRQRSCGHRSCPQCQHHSNSAWLTRQQARLLPTSYFMITFTLPAQLRALAYANPKLLYPAMFGVAISTLNTFAANHPRLHGQPGACAVLHTHSRRLDYHPHVHLIVPGGVIDAQRKQWRKLKGDYLFNGRQLATVFRARLLAALNRLELALPDQMPARWNAQCQYVGKGLPALKYLARYLYRGVINENNLISFDRDDRTVTFRYRDSQSGQWRYRTLSLTDFLWRMMMQVLPKGFRRVRDYGFLHGNTRARLVLLQLLLNVTSPVPAERVARPFQCTQCHADMRLIAFLKPT
jgi:hypothetical protein